MRRFAAFVTLLAAAACSAAQDPPELGAVRFARELEPALAAAAKDGRPVLLLFQEVPG